MATMKMSGCMKIVARMPQADQDALLARLDQYQEDGIPAEQAQMMAATDMLEEIRAERAQIFNAIAEQFPDLLSVQEEAVGVDGKVVSTDDSAADVNLQFSRRTKPDPEKTVTAYKLFRVDARKPGQLFPLFVNANDPVEMGVWLDADVGEQTAGGKVKSKLGPLAYRPGWHAGDVPIATHIGSKSDSKKTAPDIRPANHVWAEVEMAADRDWQDEANKRGTNSKGKLIAGKAHITDQIPEDGYYRYKTNPNMTGTWLIGGSMKVNRILSDTEVKEINDAAGVADLPREQPFDAAKYGFAASRRQRSFYRELMPEAGYERITDQDSPKIYKDKSGNAYATFEKDGARAAFSSNNILYEDDRGRAMVGYGEENESIFRALIVDADKRQQGRATAVMQDVVSAADQAGTVLYLEPTPIEGNKMSAKQLADFYKRFGFEQAKEGSDKVLVRQPEQAAFSRRQRQASGTVFGRDEVGRVNFAPGAKAYDLVANVANKVLEKISMRPVSDELGRAMRNMKVEVERVQNQTAATAEELAKIPQDEREMISDVIEGELKAGVKPPKRVLQLAASMQSIMSEQSRELVRLGMLSPEAAARWDNKYLPRFYTSKLGDEVKAWAKATKNLFSRQPMMQGIRGNSLKARGMFETIDVADLATWQAQGWEQRDPDFDPATSTETVVWRDYTRKEREDMGEIRDAMFRFVMGYNRSQRDIALGRLYESLAQNYASKGPKDGYVLVPNSKVEGTMAPRYGKLAGKYVPKEVMDHLSVNDESMMEGLFKIYRAGLAKWKEGKTVLNPVSHANNVISNVTMAHFAGVSYWDANKYAGAVRDLLTKNPMVNEAKDIGLFGGTFNQSEIVASMPPQLRAMAGMSESKLGKMGEGIWDILAWTVSWNGKKYGARPVMQWAYENEDLFFRYVVYRDARKRGMKPEDAREYSQQFLFTYDDLPKGARIVRDFGMPFFAYTFKVVPVLARTALEYPWRYAAPAAVAYAANAMMYAMAASLGGDEDDWWGKVLYKYATDEKFRAKAKALEEEERKNLPDWMKGQSVMLGTPKAVRLGMDEATGLPLFLDISRIFPGGDLLDAQNNAGGVALLQPLTPSNPVLTTTVAMLANKDMFFGKEVVKETDTSAEKTQKRAAWLWRQVTPAISVGNYHFDRGMNVLANITEKPITINAGPLGIVDYTGVGKDGLPVQPGYAALQTMGVKVRPYDLEVAEKINKSNQDRLIRDLTTEINRINRLEGRGTISPDAADLMRDRLRDKRDRLREGLTVDGDER